MQEHLWDLNIEDIPLGWDDIYKQALEECPNGEYEHCEDTFGESTYWCNPVACKSILISKFNSLKLQAKQIFDDKNLLSRSISELFSIDVMLYNILSNWTFTEYEFSSFNDTKFLDNINDLEVYFDEAGCSIKDYLPMRFIHQVDIAQ